MPFNWESCKADIRGFLINDKGVSSLLIAGGLLVSVLFFGLKTNVTETVAIAFWLMVGHTFLRVLQILCVHWLFPDNRKS